jgi:hypothetical protein
VRYSETRLLTRRRCNDDTTGGSAQRHWQGVQYGGTLRSCLFRLLAASGHQKLLRTNKRSTFQPASIKFVGAKTIQNQHKHIIGWVVVIVGIRHFLDPEPYEQLYLSTHVIVMILRFSPQPDSPHNHIFKKAGQKKAETNRSEGQQRTGYPGHCLTRTSALGAEPPG